MQEIEVESDGECIFQFPPIFEIPPVKLQHISWDLPHLNFTALLRTERTINNCKTCIFKHVVPKPLDF